MNNEYKDGYTEFFKRFNIVPDQLLEFAREHIILIDEKKAYQNWNLLKENINNENQDVYVRSYGRNGKGNHLYMKLYKELFKCNVKIDPSNNTQPTKLLEDLTEYTKKGKTANLINYQVSHIFGNTKNPYTFCSPWNIAFIPKILDPFTGHESKGELTNKITTLYKNIIWDKYEDLIDDYNHLMSNLKVKIDKFIEDEHNGNKRFHDSIRNEFSIIKREKS